MLIFNPPKSNVFLTAGDQLVTLNRAELYGQDVEVTDLFGQQHWFSCYLDFADIKH